MLLGLLTHHRLVDVWVEMLSVGGEGDQPLLAEHVGELLAGGGDAAADVALGLQRAVQVVHNGQKLLHQMLGGDLGYALLLPLLALAVVLELRLRPAKAVEVLVALPASLLQLGA